MKILIISAHMDDETLGTGGVIAFYKAQKTSVRVLFIANRTYNHKYNKEKNSQQEAHALKAKTVLGYDESIFLRMPDERLDRAIQELIIHIEQHVNEFRPDTVYLPFRGDNNQDHRAVFDAARVALRPLATPFVKNIYMYEVPSSTDQSPPLIENVFIPNCHVDISDHFQRKIEACMCYETERRPYPHPRSKEALEVHAKKRGIEAGFDYAEAFMILRQKWGR